MFWKKKSQKPLEEEDKSAPMLYWINETDPRNIFGLKFLDCRPITQTYTSTPEAMGIVETYSEHKVPLQIDNQSMSNSRENELYQIETELNYPLQEYDDGLIYRAEDLQYKWNIYQFNNCLYFKRAWEDQLVYSVPIEIVENQLKITNFQVIPDYKHISREHLTREIDFLIKSHLYNIVVPHPIKPELEGQKDDVVAYSAFTNWGRLGSFATFEDTLKLNFKTLLAESGLEPVTKFNKIID